MALLSVKDLCVDYVSQARRVRAVDHFSLDLEEGESLGIVGESGSGKSTLVMALMRLLPKGKSEVTGRAELEGEDLIGLSENRLVELRWQKMSIVFQKAMNSVSPVHRVGYFMQDVYCTRKPDVNKHEAKMRIEELLDLVGLSPRVYGLFPHELSGGMMQRVGIALSLMFNPKLLIMDEATTALDVVTQTQILDKIMELESELGITRIMVTHDISVVASTCKNVAVMYAGRCLETGPVTEVLLEPLHPYTQGLIESFPENCEGEAKLLKSIPGSLPDLSDVPQGCIFAPRCPVANEACCKSVIGNTRLKDGRQVRCRLYEGGSNAQ